MARARGRLNATLLWILLGERILREGPDARTLEPTAGDRGTTRLIGVAYGAALNAVWLGPLLSSRGFGRVSHTRLPMVGLGLMVLGLTLKTWAMRTLRRLYTRTLRAAPGQPVIDTGPYRLVRHPGYLGALLLWTGFGLVVGNWITLVGITVAMTFAYARRIGSEEPLLVDELGDAYRVYQRRTWRLVPGLL